MVWDKLWNLNLFPNNVIGKRAQLLSNKTESLWTPLILVKNTQNPTGSCGRQLCHQIKKPSRNSSDPVYKYINETVSRVPISDWHHTDSGKWVGFRARSVIGGYWMKVLMDKVQNNNNLNLVYYEM